MQDFDTLWKKCIELYYLTGWYNSFILSRREDGSFCIRADDFSSPMGEGNTRIEALQSFHAYLCNHFANRIQSLKDEGNRILADAACLQIKVKSISP